MVPIRILLAHDQRAMRQSLRALLEQVPGFVVVGEVANGPAVGDAVVRHQPDVLVLGFAANGRAGVEMVRETAASNGQDRSADPYETLTPREREVMVLAAEGFGNVDIGRRLRISPRTVETHRAHLMQKMGFRRLADVIRYAIRHGMLPFEEDARR